MLIGISGKKLSGKTLCSQVLVRHILDVILDIKCFADPLKLIVLKCFVPRELNLTLRDMLEDRVKNMVMPCGKTLRKLLQIVGTDWFRNTDQQVWVRALDNSLDLSKTTIIPDVRFPNEVEYIQKQGGVVVRLLRAPCGMQDQHKSETALDAMTERTVAAIRQSCRMEEALFDYVIDNRNTTITETGKMLHTSLYGVVATLPELDESALADLEEMYNASGA